MKMNVKFTETNQTFKATFGEMVKVPDDDYERGYAEGYAEAAKALKEMQESIDEINEELDKECTVWFLDHDGELFADMIVKYNDVAMPESDPVRNGYVFTGWGLDAFENGGATIVYKARYRVENTTGVYGDACNEALILRDKNNATVGAEFNDNGTAYKTWDHVVTVSRASVHSILDKGWLILHNYDDYDFGYIVNGVEVYSKKYLLERFAGVNPTAAFSGGIYARWDASTGRWISTAVNRPIDGFNGYLSVPLLHNGENRIKFVARFNGEVKVLREYKVFVID